MIKYVIYTSNDLSKAYYYNVTLYMTRLFPFILSIHSEQLLELLV